MRKLPRDRKAATALAAGVLSVGMMAALAGGAGASGLVRHTAASGSVITYAEQPSAEPNYIFAETSSANQSLYNNSQFINLMWPLVYLPAPNQPVMDYARSMAYPPKWNANDTVATVTLKHWMWSDGQPVTARDLVFYINLGKAMGATWGNYGGPTQFPYDLKSYTALNAKTIRFVLKSRINPTFFVDNGIDYITPLPQHAWDKESANGPVGNYDMTASGAAKVLKFLQSQASDQNTYATNPLWKVIDGPWELKSFGGASSPDIFVPNPAYSGPKPKASEFEEIPFTSDAAEFTSLKAGTLDYGYVPSPDLPAIPSVKGQFNVTPIPDWGIYYMIPNLKNPQMGAVLSQAYVRQALAHLVDQSTMIKHFLFGYGIPTYGPTPIYPKGNPFVSSRELKNPFPYSVGAAEALLRAHGWEVNPGKVDICQKPGPAGCGAGVAKGQKLSLSILYDSASALSQEEVDLFQSDAAKAGVAITTRGSSFNTVISDVNPCVLPKDKSTPLCNWQIGFYGGISESTYPSGEGLLNTGGAFNAGQFSDPAMDRYINQSTVSTNLSSYKAYENIAAEQEPWIWLPTEDHAAATVKGLTGYGLTSEFCGYYGYIEPETWSLR